MLITTSFTSSKQVTSNNDCPSASSACKKSTSTSSHRGVETASVASYKSSTTTSSSSVPPLTPSEATTLNLFLRSSRSIAPLRIADIQGVIDETTGEHSIPAVRKGRIRTSSNSTSSSNMSSSSGGIQCCIIDSFPFDKCEIVATVVKKNAIYRQARPLYDSHDKGKGREISNDAREDAAPPKEEIQLIFYELDDDSGASITCCVNPAKVYAREISDSKRRQASHHSQRNGHCNEEYSTTDSESIEDAYLSNSTPRASRSKRGSDGNEDNEDTPRRVEEAKSKFDPRLWIYRYKEPPRPLPSSSTSSTSSNSSAAAFEIPLYKEGTILRIIGKIFINPQRGNERQIEVSSIECVYEEGYINEYRRKVPLKGNKYSEWHHGVKCKKKRKELFGDKEKVREFIGFGVPKERDGEESSRNSQSTTMQNVTMQDVTLPSFNESHNTTSVSHRSSTSLLNATHLPVNNTTTSITTSMSSTTGTKRKRAKLPSCSTLYKQKIPITKEIFCLYAHQYFRDLDKSARKSSTDRILPKNIHDQSMQDEGSVGCQSTGRVSLAQMKEDKILKWLAEIYARTEARRQAAVLETSLITPDNSMATPKPKNRYIPNTAESSVILPSSSPSHSLYHHRSTPRADMLMQDTTNRSISSSTSSYDTKEKKIKLKAEVVDKIRNDLFRSTILRLVKDGIIVVFPADLSSIPTSFAATRHQDSTVGQKRADECQTCKLKLKKEIEKIPPHLMTMDGITLRQYTASLHAAQICDCPPSSTSITQSKLPLRVQREEVYALLTAEMLLPVVEGVVARMGPQMGVKVENVWHTVRRTDDMWRFVSREVVKECLEMI